MPQVESSGPAWVSALGVLALKGNKKESKLFVLLDYVHWVCLHLQGEKKIVLSHSFRSEPYTLLL